VRADALQQGEAVGERLRQGPIGAHGRGRRQDGHDIRRQQYAGQGQHTCGLTRAEFQSASPTFESHRPSQGGDIPTLSSTGAWRASGCTWLRRVV